MKVIRVENQQQNFGMSFKIDPCAEKILKKRLKEEDLAKFQELISSQKNNKNVDIFLCPPEFSFFHDRKLGANISPKKYTDKIPISISESLFTIFRSPLHFIELLCKKADKMSKNIESTQNVNDVVDSVAKNSLMVDITKHWKFNIFIKISNVL